MEIFHVGSRKSFPVVAVKIKEIDISYIFSCKIWQLSFSILILNNQSESLLTLLNDRPSADLNFAKDGVGKVGCFDNEASQISHVVHLDHHYYHNYFVAILAYSSWKVSPCVSSYNGLVKMCIEPCTQYCRSFNLGTSLKFHQMVLRPQRDWNKWKKSGD